MDNLLIRPEEKKDINAIETVIIDAFKTVSHSNQKEYLLVTNLREKDLLFVSLVVQIDDKIVGHIAFSAVKISGDFCSWYGLAPLSILPSYQKQGIGSELVLNGLKQIKS